VVLFLCYTFNRACIAVLGHVHN